MVIRTTLLFSAVMALAAGGANAQSVLSKAVRTSESMEPALVHRAAGQPRQQKLDALRAKTGKRPNIVWLVRRHGLGRRVSTAAARPLARPHRTWIGLPTKGLKLTSTYSQPTCTPTRSAILTGRLPVRTGLTRPILAGDNITKNPWADEILVAKLLGEAGYKTVLSGKWHVGEQVGMRPHDIGFDEFYGFYEAEKEISQGVDKRRYPDLVLNPERLEMLARPGRARLWCTASRAARPRTVEKIDSIEKMAEGDRMLKEFTVDKIAELAKGDKPFFLEHAFMKVHADNFASKDSRARAAEISLQG